MSFEVLLWLLLAAAFHAALVLLIPLVPLAAGCRLINAVQRARLPFTPAIETMALVLGAIMGIVLLARYAPPGSLNLANLFAADSYWNVSLGQFLTDRVNPLDYPLYGALLPAGNGGLTGYAIFPAVVAVTTLPLLIDRGPAGIANSARNLLILVWAAYGTIYLVSLLYWLVALLNFVVFLIALLLIQAARRRP